MLFSFLKRDKNQSPGQAGNELSKLLCRFVLDGQGRKVGESIAISEDVLIIKTGKDFLGVPIKHIDEDGHRLLVKGLIDQTKALELGAKWQKAAYNKITYPKEEK